MAASSGVLDHTGGMKPMSYERQSWWSEKLMVHITRRVAPQQAAVTDPGYEANARRVVQTLFDDWTPSNAAVHEENVEVYSNCEEVELSLNGKSLGAKPLAKDAAPRVWRVPFEAGVLKAVGRNTGQTVATHELRTAGKPAKIVLAADRSGLTTDWDDVTTITATVVDENGVVVPSAANIVKFEVTGPGAVIATDNADNTSHEPFQSPERHVFQSRGIAIVRAKAAGRISVRAVSEGLTSIPVAIDAK